MRFLGRAIIALGLCLLAHGQGVPPVPVRGWRKPLTAWAHLH
jgi:hypothetical protein